MKQKFDIDKSECCIDCAMIIANNDASGMDSERQAEVETGLEEYRDAKLSLGEETGFTWRKCPICGGLAGDRFELFIMWPVNRVQFRKMKEGDILAVLPDVPANPGRYMSYQHIGQHCECSADIASFTKPATEEEYKPLYDELTRIGYRLQVVRRITSDKIN